MEGKDQATLAMGANLISIGKVIPGVGVSDVTGFQPFNSTAATLHDDDNHKCISGLTASPPRRTRVAAAASARSRLTRRQLSKVSRRKSCRLSSNCLRRRRKHQACNPCTSFLSGRLNLSYQLCNSSHKLWMKSQVLFMVSFLTLENTIRFGGVYSTYSIASLPI